MIKNNNSIIEKDKKYIGKCTRAEYFPIVVKEANGVIIKDYENNEYIDMISSACVMNTGYNHPKVISAIENQIKKYTHFANDYFYSEPQVELAEKLIEITPGKFDKKVIFGFSGSDAIDTSIKVSRAYTKRSKIVSFIGAYHGSTYGAISVSAIDLNMKRNIGPLLPDIYHLSYPSGVDKNKDEDWESYGLRKFDEFIKHFKYYIPVEEVAAIIIEPIAGDLGLVIPPQKFLENLRNFCNKNGILLVVDEIQQGFGRTGKWFSIEHFNIIPDIIVMGKAMASGMPMSAIVARQEIIDSIEMPGQLFTLQGNAICATASLATINVIEEENLLERANQLGHYIQSRFMNIKNETGLIKEVRGLGLTIGVELNANDNYTATDIAKKITYRLYERGVILIYLGGNTLRVQPPLILSDEIAKKVMDIVEKVFVECKNGLIDDEILTKMKGW